jgi:hypothetical protein
MVHLHSLPMDKEFEITLCIKVQEFKAAYDSPLY